MEPLFTVVLPTYNRAGMLRSAIESVLWQTCGDYECFVLDNHSSDATPAVFEHYANAPRFTFKRFDENRGVQQSRNHAIRHARGRYITFLDSDDLWLKDRLARFKDILERRPGAGFVFSNAYEFRYGRIVGKLFPEGRPIPEGRVPGHYAVGEDQLPYVTTNLAVAREAFEKVGLYSHEVKLLDDTELYSRILGAGYEVAVIREPLAVRTLHESQITHGYRQAYEDALLSLRSGGAGDALVAERRARLAFDAAVFFLKAAHPEQARAFLSEAGLSGPRAWALAAAARTPAPLLRAGRALRKAYLRTRRGPWLQSPEFRRVEREIAPLLALAA